MWIAELWRYPVKSMGGERLESADATSQGIAGDRMVMVVRGERIITARTHPRLLRHHATIGPDGEPLIDGLSWSARASAESVKSDAGLEARLVRWDGPERFDILPLLIATDGAIAALREDGRRLGPNIVIGGVDGLAEREWEGKCLRIGSAIIQVHDLRQRCVMTTYHPDTQEQNVNVLRRIVREFGGTMALNCSVVAPATIHSGETVAILDR
jgi:MOSC domain-containing protein